MIVLFPEKLGHLVKLEKEVLRKNINIFEVEMLALFKSRLQQTNQISVLKDWTTV